RRGGAWPLAVPHSSRHARDRVYREGTGRAMRSAIAPGGPGSRPTWTSSAKDIVTTALGTSRVWVTLGYGILNEIYWPATGLPQIRDLGFIVAGPSEWFEVKRANRYHVSMPDDWVPLPQVAHEGDGYRLLIEVLPDPSRDVVLILYRLTGDNMNLYALLAPHLSNGGEHNNARAAEDLTASPKRSASPRATSTPSRRIV